MGASAGLTALSNDYTPVTHRFLTLKHCLTTPRVRSRSETLLAVVQEGGAQHFMCALTVHLACPQM